jgi:hypothetical protein
MCGLLFSSNLGAVSPKAATAVARDDLSPNSQKIQRTRLIANDSHIVARQSPAICQPLITNHE